jgi:hypothetical protein
MRAGRIANYSTAAAMDRGALGVSPQFYGFYSFRTIQIVDGERRLHIILNAE